MDNGQEIWEAVVTSYYSHIETINRFLTNDIDRVSILKKALHSSDRNLAIQTIERLKIDELKQLFEELVFFASFSHGAVGAIRELIKTLPKEWVISNIERLAEPLLVNGTYDEYRRLLELYLEIDTELTKRLAKKAIQSKDFDIREAGEDFLMKIGS